MEARSVDRQSLTSYLDSFGSKFNMLAEGGDKRGLIEVVQGAAKSVILFLTVGLIVLNEQHFSVLEPPR